MRADEDDLLAVLDGAAQLVDRPVREPDGPAAEVLTGLARLQRVRERLDAWEPRLIAAARRAGASWAELAPALGVASRQAAERRYLRLRTAGPDDAGTGDQRVQAVRDRRAGDRAVDAWARTSGAELRQLAGQVSALTDLDTTARASLDRLHHALGDDDPAALVPLLADTRQYLSAGHASLSDRITAVAEQTEHIRRATQRDRTRRRADRSPVLDGESETRTG